MRGIIVAEHPDVEKIIEFVFDGYSYADISKAIKKKYKSTPSLWLTIDIIRRFVLNYIEISPEELARIRKIRKADRKKNGVASKRNERESTAIKKVKSSLKLMEKKVELVEIEKDILNEQDRLHSMILNEIDSINDRADKITGHKDWVGAKQTIISAMSELRKLFVDMKDVQKSSATTNINADNVTINYASVNEQIGIIKMAIVETFREMNDQESLIRFKKIFRAKLDSLSEDDDPTVSGGFSDAQVIDTEIIDVEG